MVPPQELAIHAPLPTRAATTPSWIFAVDRTANELEPVPHGNTLPTTVPWYVAPARLRVVLNACPLMLPESRTSHGPVTQAGLASHDSSHFLWPVREEAPRTIFRWTVHAPCSRAAASGGMEVRTASTVDRAERLPPRTAAAVLVCGGRSEARYPVRRDGPAHRPDHLAVVEDLVPVGRRARRGARPVERDGAGGRGTRGEPGRPQQRRALPRGPEQQANDQAQHGDGRDHGHQDGPLGPP